MPKYLLRLQENWTPNNDYGQDLAEYALLLGLIAVVVMVAVMALGNSLLAFFNTPHRWVVRVPDFTGAGGRRGANADSHAPDGRKIQSQPRH